MSSFAHSDLIVKEMLYIFCPQEGNYSQEWNRFRRKTKENFVVAFFVSSDQSQYHEIVDKIYGCSYVCGPIWKFYMYNVIESEEYMQSG